MVIPFDSLAATEAMESAGIESRHARAIAARLHAASRAGEAVTRPILEAARATLKTGLPGRIPESERRTAAPFWRLFGGMAAVRRHGGYCGIGGGVAQVPAMNECHRAKASGIRHQRDDGIVPRA